MAETKKTHERRLREGWYERYMQSPIIDVGGHADPLDQFVEGAFCYDIARNPRSDAQIMRDIQRGVWGTVYASHILEHLPDPVSALRHWWDCLAPGGWLIVCIPHVALYEKQWLRPSRWNGDHKTYWMIPAELEKGAYEIAAMYPYMKDVPVPFPRHVHSIVGDAEMAGIPSAEIELLDYGWTQNGMDHSGGEYSIELRARKPQ